jgi:phosphoglycolate phosphatase
MGENMPVSTPRHLLFDLDGTLTNNHAGISRSIAFALGRLGCPEPGAEALRDAVGPPLRQTFGRLLGTAETAPIEQALRHYRERYATVGWTENEIYPGIAQALEELTSRGHVLFLCTSKPRVFAERILAHFQLAALFAGIYGPELDGRYDHKDALLGHILSQQELAPHSCLMIGDREHDALAARAHGVSALGVLYGFGTAEELLAAGAVALVAEAVELPAAIARLGGVPGKSR